MLSHMFVDIARAEEVRHRSSKVLSWIRRPTADTFRDLIAGKEPNSNRARGPFHSVHSTTSTIEAFTVRVRPAVLHATPSVARTNAAIISDQRSGPALTSNRAIVTCVQTRKVSRGSVGAFNDVDLAAVWPVRAESPECGPGATAKWHMR